MNESLNIEQTQQTVQRLSPRQVQFVRILEMSGPEIEAEVRKQLDDNPALETADSMDNDHEEVQLPDTSIDNDPDDDPADYLTFQHGHSSDDAYIPQIADDTPDLYTYLLRQLGESNLSERQKQIAAYIIGNIDENGYMTRTLAEIRDDIEIDTSIEVSHDEILDIFRTVRAFDPPGVGAVDLRDCLLIQLNRMHPNTLTIRAAKDIVSNYFDLLSKKHLDRLQQHLGIRDKHEMEAALELIRSLNPKPGSSIPTSSTSVKAEQISPEVAVEVTEDGRFAISLKSNIPQLQIEKSFDIESPEPAARDRSRTAENQREALAFIKLKRDEAEAFISALKQRASTIMAVTEAIVKLQPEFFKTGESAKLRPMILKDIASVTGLDISVISRATAGKYVETSTGIYPFKKFFSEAPNDNSDVSKHEILHVLQEIINSEDKRHPLSDEALREAIAKKGYNVARRTITKYRESLNIPVGRLRKSL